METLPTQLAPSTNLGLSTISVAIIRKGYAGTKVFKIAQDETNSNALTSQ